jgi:Bifunctional DNA primase/polymerase, N-terminal
MTDKDGGGGPSPGAATPPTDHHHHDRVFPDSGGGDRQGASPRGGSPAFSAWMGRIDAHLASLGLGHTAFGHRWGIGLSLLADDERQFVIDLDRLGVPIWAECPGGEEFCRLRRWQQAGWQHNGDRIGGWKPGMCLCANTGGLIAVVDIDPRNGGDIEAVRQLLADLKVRIFAEVVTPGGGRHFYIAAHKSLASAHKIPGFPGVDVQAKGANVFLPGTRRPKYVGKGYSIVFNDLAELLR